MPAERGKDSKGCFYRWGTEGKKYYFECSNKLAEKIAEGLAKRQGRAIEANNGES